MRRANGVVVLAAVLGGCFATMESPAKIDTQKVRALKTFPYDDWRAVTRRFVDTKGRVDYAALKKARHPLDRFVALLALVGPRTRPDLFATKDAQLAYYINAYNALVLFNVIERYPKIRSVNDHKSSFFYFTEFKLDGDEVSLHALENKIVRPRFSDPRVHFALNCASIGCPPLRREAYTAARLEEQLADQARRVHRESRWFRFDEEAGVVYLTKLYDWYGSDFRQVAGSVLGYAARHAPRLAGADLDALDVRFLDYDWDMNAQESREEGAAR